MIFSQGTPLEPAYRLTNMMNETSLTFPSLLPHEIRALSAIKMLAML